LSGLLADNKGTEWAVTLFIGCAVPWWIVIAVRLPVELFVTAFAIESKSVCRHFRREYATIFTWCRLF
jgi:hypothetical protein